MLKKIWMKQFRNYTAADLTFEQARNVIIGPNGQGKTNLLEAIFFLSMLRSFRTNQIRDLKQIGSKGFYIAGELATDRAWDRVLEVEYHLKRKLKVDEQPVSKASEFIKQFRTVVFSPDDMMIVTGSSSFRRRFINMMISSINPLYLNALQQYHTALGHRNSMLKNRADDQALFQAYEAIMAENGACICRERAACCGQLQTEMAKLVANIKQNDDQIEIRYRCSSESSDKNAFRARLERDRRKDREKGWTGSGPQLDDFDLLFNQKLLRNFGSTGQCRLIALCLKMGKLSLLNQAEEGRNDVVALVDDVTGELDLPTKTEFYNVLSQADQMFFTFTELPDESFFQDAAHFNVDDGIILPQ